MKKTVFLIVKEHFDIIWRRCFDRDFEYKRQNFVSYADLEGYYIIDNIELAKKHPEYRFEIESVAVLRKFLEKNPQYEQIIGEYIKEKRIYIPFSGDNIVDSNMTQGESFVRNYLHGYRYLKDNFDFVPDGMDRNDAFGNSAQIPQIARKFGTKWVYHLVYSDTDKDTPFWKGVDGSIVYNFRPKCVGSYGSYYKYRPCPVCNGYKDTDCPACNNRRIDVPHMEKMRHDGLNISEDRLPESGTPAYIYIGGEEILPIDHVFEWIEENKDKYNIVFATFEDYFKYVDAEIGDIDNVNPEKIHKSPECNCNNTGTYVTRIKLKQLIRALENRIYALETVATANSIDKRAYPKKAFTKVWEQTFFTIFHDAITATHIDAAYFELMDTLKHNNFMLDEIEDEQLKLISCKEENTVTVYNPYGITINSQAKVILTSDTDVILKDENNKAVSVFDYVRNGDKIEITFEVKDIKPFSKKKFKTEAVSGIYPTQSTIDFTKDGQEEMEAILTNKSTVAKDGEASGKETVIENEFYRVTAVENGITEIYDKKLDRVVAKQSEYMVGEWILEHDEGSPWATLSSDLNRRKMSNNTKLIRYEKTADCEKLVFKFSRVFGYSVAGFGVEYSVSLLKNSDKVYFEADVFWEEQNNRLRIAFPTTLKGKHIYEIPYAKLERKPYEPEFSWAAASGDYPAINWAGIEADGVSAALFNKGTPSYQINTDCNGIENIYLSVLRAPSVGTYLHSPEEYVMTDYDGMRDGGNHHFEYAFKTYREGFDDNSVVADGIGYNAHMITANGDIDICKLPVFESDDVRVASVKPAEIMNGLIYRLVEYHGKDSKIKITLPEYVKNVYETDLKEDIINKLNVVDNTIEVDVKKYEIKTLYFETA